VTANSTERAAAPRKLFELSKVTEETVAGAALAAMI